MTKSVTPESKQSLAADFSSIKAHAQAYLDAVQHYLESQVEAFVPEVRELVSYTIEKGGKRIRPVLVYFSGYHSADVIDPALVKLGSVVELVHTATLVHDDILDQAMLRHGKPSVCEQHGSAVAVLLGDALFSHALRLAAEFPTMDICREIATSMRTVCAGEIHQTFRRGDRNTSLTDYYRAIEMKTAELFRVSCFLGAKTAGYPESFAEACAIFGNCLGNAYQIFDDFADLFSTEDRMGKTLMTDLEKGKFTLPLILLFEKLTPEQVRTWVQPDDVFSGNKVAELQELLKRHGIQEQVVQHFDHQIHTAARSIEAFEALPATARLKELLGFVSAQIRLLT